MIPYFRKDKKAIAVYRQDWQIAKEKNEINWALFFQITKWIYESDIQVLRISHRHLFALTSLSKESCSMSSPSDNAPSRSCLLANLK